MANKLLLYSLFAIVVLAIIVVAYLWIVNMYGSSAYAVQITDPPIVPKGTQSLIVNYSSVRLNEAGTDNTLNISVNGSVDLLTLNGTTRTIAVVKNASNQSFSGVTLVITAAQIEINNSTYNVTVSNPNITQSIKASVGGNSSATGGVLIYLTPSITQSSSGNFMMSTSASAVAISRIDVNATGTGHVGATANLTVNESGAIGIKTVAAVNSTLP